jgi:uncharacterized membrane protein
MMGHAELGVDRVADGSATAANERAKHISNTPRSTAMTESTMPPSSTPPGPSAPEMSQQEIDAGKTMAILCYIPIALIGLIVSIVCLAQKNNAFSLYHAKQALTLYIVAFVAGMVCIPLLFVCIGVPLLIAVEVGGLVLLILGIVNSSSGQCKPLPLIGPFADKMFGNIKKA